MDMNSVRQQLMLESQRRASNMGASNAGTSPNPSASGTLRPTTASNPLQTQMSSANTSGVAMPQQGNPLAGAMDAVQKAAPNEATLLTKGLLKRLHNLPAQ